MTDEPRIINGVVTGHNVRTDLQVNGRLMLSSRSTTIRTVYGELDLPGHVFDVGERVHISVESETPRENQ